MQWVVARKIPQRQGLFITSALLNYSGSRRQPTADLRGPSVFAIATPRQVARFHLRALAASRSGELHRGRRFGPTRRARCEAPTPAPGSDHGLVSFQPAGSLTTGQYKWAVSKQRERPQTANRLEGNAMPPRRLLWVRGSFSL